MKFLLNGCDIWFVAEAPEDMTVAQLVKQGSRIIPDYCACGICDLPSDFNAQSVDIIFDYNDVWKASEDVSCSIK